MNKYNIHIFIILFCSILPSKMLFGQDATNDRPLQPVVANMVKAYQKAIGPHSQLYRGAFYEYYDRQITGTGYFQDSVAFSNGTVKYDGITYKDVPLLYDEYAQLVITLLYNNFQKLSLLSEYVSEFDLRGHHFIKFQPEESNKHMDAGFYDELYNNNKHQLLMKRVKSLQQEGLTAKKYFISNNTFYLKKGGIYYSVNSKGQLYDVLKDKKKELNQYFRKTSLSFSGEKKEQAILMLVTYYNSITN